MSAIPIIQKIETKKREKTLALQTLRATSFFEFERLNSILLSLT